MATREINVLFLCMGNSARSTLAEALLNRFGEGRFQAFSAGSHPKGQVHPLALRLLQERGIPTDRLRSKSWEEFAAAGAPAMDLIVTVCDNAAGEVCPVWPGQPATAHWGVQDPAAVEGTETECMRAFERAAKELEKHIRLLTALHLDQSDRSNLKERLDRIGHSGTEED
jgi:arsenate reductase (thioredoxin)